MSNDLKNVLITGCSRGLGLSLAVRLVKESYTVYATMRNTKDKKELLSFFDSPPKNLILLELDLEKEPSINSAVNFLVKNHIDIDILVNNGAIAPLDGIDQDEEISVRKVFNINFFGTLLLTKKIIPMMKKKKKGRILFISSTVAIEPSYFLGAYSSSKSALESAAMSMAPALLKDNIYISILQLSGVNTGLIAPLTETSKSTNTSYKNAREQFRTFLKSLLSKSASPTETAKDINKILLSPKPHLKYQIGEYSESLGQKYLKDKEGEIYLSEFQKHYLKIE